MTGADRILCVASVRRASSTESDGESVTTGILFSGRSAETWVSTRVLRSASSDIAVSVDDD